MCTVKHAHATATRAYTAANATGGAGSSLPSAAPRLAITGASNEPPLANPRPLQTPRRSLD